MANKKQIKYIDMRKFLSHHMNWSHPEFSILADTLGGNKKDNLPDGFWEINEKWITEKELTE